MSGNEGRVLACHGVLSGANDGSAAAHRAYHAFTSVTRAQPQQALGNRATSGHKPRKGRLIP